MSWIGKLLGTQDDGEQAIAEYNLGLAAKYEGRWEESLRHNQRAAALNTDDEATWWNLAIAATALRDWAEARRAWIKVGVTPEQEEGEVTTPQQWACVRLVPDGQAEVVWGMRIDPARMRVMNVPMPTSQRRYGDIILNDGAQEGTRLSNGGEYPVFNELAVWQRSSYSTYQVEVRGGSPESKASLGRICQEEGVEFEDWGTVRVLCAECSKGNPGEHACTAPAGGAELTAYGFAAHSEAAVVRTLSGWTAMNPEVSFDAPAMLVAGANA